MNLPEFIESEEQLEELLSRPYPETIEAVKRLGGDFIVIGAGGKIGPSLVLMLLRAIKEAHLNSKVYAVSRFSRGGELVQRLISAGAEVISCDVLDRNCVENLPKVANVIFMVGRKFGTTGKEVYTWATNVIAPIYVAERYRDSHILVFSSGNVYPFVPISSGGATEEMPPNPIGEYAMSVLGRERIFEYFSITYGTKVTIFRLNYACELRYGVLLDIAIKVLKGEPIDLRMGYVNVVWQGDVNNAAIRSLEFASSPPMIINYTGPEIISVRWLAEIFGKLLDRKPIFTNSEEETALLSNAAKAFKLLGYPKVPLMKMIEWVAFWVKNGKPIWNLPTHFEVRDGRF